MEVLRDGTFVFTIGSDELSKGLRPSKRLPRNNKFLVDCIGAVGLDGVIQVVDDLELSRIDTSTEITDTFPYPQVFVFTNVILVCDSQNIYEYLGGVLSLVIGPVTAGRLWSAIDFYSFVYLSNGEVSIIRDPNTGLYALDAVQPVGEAIGDFNGQVMVGGLS
jgi:hypothetical protein